MSGKYNEYYNRLQQAGINMPTKEEFNAYMDTDSGRRGGGGGSSGKPYGTFMGRPIMNQKDWEYEIYTSATEDEITKATERTGLTSKRINYTKLRSLVENRLNKK